MKRRRARLCIMITSCHISLRRRVRIWTTLGFCVNQKLTNRPPKSMQLVRRVASQKRWVPAPHRKLTWITLLQQRRAIHGNESRSLHVRHPLLVILRPGSVVDHVKGLSRPKTINFVHCWDDLCEILTQDSRMLFDFCRPLQKCPCL